MSETTNVRPYTIDICDDCVRLKGDSCHNPRCIFCRWTMDEVGQYLDALLIRPIVDGERLNSTEVEL